MLPSLSNVIVAVLFFNNLIVPVVSIGNVVIILFVLSIETTVVSPFLISTLPLKVDVEFTVKVLEVLVPNITLALRFESPVVVNVPALTISPFSLIEAFFKVISLYLSALLPIELISVALGVILPVLVNEPSTRAVPSKL
jgi:hypothetical protein